MAIYSQHTAGLLMALPAGAVGGDLDVVATAHGDSVVVTVANLNAVGWFGYTVTLSIANTVGALTSAVVTTLASQGIQTNSVFNTTIVTLPVTNGRFTINVPPFSVAHAVVS